jgi:imidazole glycerol-phosphate synthase subunit HisH
VITIVDYGVGNIHSLLNMYEYLGIDAQACSEPNAIADAERLILPGVGAFDKAMHALSERNLIPALEYAVNYRFVPLLGICLGMQLLARSSEEGELPGLGWLSANVRRINVRFDLGLKVPHMGWSEVTLIKSSPLFLSEDQGERFYFVHGYHLEYGDHLCCAVNKKNIWGVQFHPEKSHRHGMKLLSAFAKIEGSER